jgi:hypothetical protein
VLPDVVAHQRALAVHHRAVLVRAGLDRELAVLVDGHEHPARAELASACSVEVVLEFFHAAEIAIDRGQYLAFRLAAARAHDLPEHGVVGVAAEIVANGDFDAVVERVEIAEHVRHRRRRQLWIGLGETVEVGDEGLVMPVVMDFHRLGVDMGLERSGRISQWRQREGTGWGGGRGRSGGLCEYSMWGCSHGSDTACSQHQMTPGYG